MEYQLLFAEFPHRCRLSAFSPFCLVIAGLFPGAFMQAQSTISLTDVTDSSGIDFTHTDGSYGQRFLIESMSAGLALVDYDSDGDLDIYFLNGAAIQNEEAHHAANALYRNDGQFHFTDVTAEAGVGDTGMGLGVTCGDFDNDGWPDIYVNNYGDNVLYRNNGDGSFSDATQSAAVAGGGLVGGGAAFLDMDADGDLDLYVANYIQFDPSSHRVHMHKGLPSYPSPMSYQPEFDTLFENDGTGTFKDVSEESGIRSVAGRSMGIVAFDYDNDGDVDVVVANDTQENHVFENDGSGHFEEVALTAGLAYDYRGKAQASMGIALLDANRDGLLDLYMTSFSEEQSTLYENLGGGLFDDVTLRTGALEATLPHVTWGVVAADFDLDGNQDLLIGTGDLDDNRHLRGGASTTTAYRVPNVLLQGNHAGKFLDLEQNWGTAAAVTQSTRGLVAGDLDNDGKLDAVALNARDKPTVMRNESSDAPRVVVRLIGTTSNRSAHGARVQVDYAGKSQFLEVHSGDSYQSHNGQQLHFSLPSNSSTEVRITVKWPTGVEQVEAGDFRNRSITVRESMSAEPLNHF